MQKILHKLIGYYSMTESFDDSDDASCASVKVIIAGIRDYIIDYFNSFSRNAIKIFCG